jgi:hypothetical protein
MKLTLAALALTLNEVTAQVIDPDAAAPVCADADGQRCPADKGLFCQTMTVTAVDATAVTYGLIATKVF